MSFLTPAAVPEAEPADEDVAVQSYVYGLGEGGPPSPQGRPAPRPAQAWDYVVRVLASWPPAAQADDADDDEERREPGAPPASW